MSHTETIAYWQREISMHLPHLSRPQAAVLALWSYGMVLSKSSGITTIVSFLAKVLACPKDNLRQRLREWCYDAKDKAGRKRAELDLEACFAPLLSWILSHWASQEHQLALALDATTLSSRFTVLAISVQYRGCAIPVAWYVMPAHQKGTWRSQWEALLQAIAPSIPSEWMVIVMADRGLYAPWLYQQIVALGWHPFLRVNEQVLLRPQGSQEPYRWVSEWVRKPGEQWSAKVECGQEERLCCTMLIGWEEGYDERWVIVTDLPPEESEIAWYSMRFWIEGGFKDQKRGGWQWHHTKMRDPRRAGRLWLAMAVATLWVVGVGGNAEAEEEIHKSVARASNEEKSAEGVRGEEKPPRGREESCFLRGRLLILAMVVRAEPLPLGRFVPQAWPTKLYPVLKASSAWAKRKREKQQKRREKQRRKERKRDQKRRQKTYP